MALGVREAKPYSRLAVSQHSYTAGPCLGSIVAVDEGHPVNAAHRRRKDLASIAVVGAKDGGAAANLKTDFGKRPRSGVNGLLTITDEWE
jgi:hypothetical protein